MIEDRPGDIVLYPVTGRSSPLSKVVATAQLWLGVGRGVESYSHAAVLDVDGYEYEAKWPKTGRYRIDTDRPYEVWRIDGVTEAQRRHVLQWCQAHCDEWYDLAALVTFGMVRHIHRAVCSQFVARAYASAGVHFGSEGKRLVSPNAIVDNIRARLVRRYS